MRIKCKKKNINDNNVRPCKDNIYVSKFLQKNFLLDGPKNVLGACVKHHLDAIKLSNAWNRTKSNIVAYSY